MQCEHRIILFAVALGAALACSSPPPPDEKPLGPETCTNGVDDNGDGKTDCADPKCFEDPGCAPGGAEQCTNDLDDDANGQIDCADAACAQDPSCQLSGNTEVCTGGADEDQDGQTDCADADCANDPACKPQENCTNNKEDTGDGLIDCQDPTCSNHIACPSAEGGKCSDGMDNDGDGATDCQDADCAASCPAGENTDALCSDGQDNDNDFLVDCNDSSCLLTAPCLGKLEALCANGVDDDNDGQTDCKDSDCAQAANCQNPATEMLCGDNVDNDGDNQTDCQDSDCNTQSCGTGCTCAATSKTETACNDTADNDADGAADCMDSDCAQAANCQVVKVDDGQPCTADAQCKGGKCMTELATGFPGGMCTNMTACTVGTTTGCNGGTCYQSGSGTRCNQTCTGTAGCRPGYECYDPDANGSTANSYCIPLCSADSQCTATGQGATYGCNPWSKFCSQKDTGKAKYGAPCTAHADCEGLWCDTSKPGGYCLGVCEGTTKSCGGDGRCLMATTETDNVGTCYDGCTGDSNCRPNTYSCLTSSAGNVCYCLAPYQVCSQNRDCCSGKCNSFFGDCDP